MLSRRGFLKTILGFPFVFISRKTSAKKFFLFETYIAGYRYYDGEKIENTLYSGKALLLKREPENRYDDMAIEVYTPEGVKLGYIPRKYNQIPANLIDQGVTIKAAVQSVFFHNPPWERVKIVLFMEAFDV
jgi:hypothetical protein